VDFEQSLVSQASNGASTPPDSSPVGLPTIDAIDVDPPAASDGASKPSFTGGAWAQVSVGEIPAGTSSLGATVDDKGVISIVPADSAAGPGKYVAWGTFKDSLDQVGWSSLSMHLADGAGVDDGVKMYAAGVVEGYLTMNRMRQFFHNSRALVEMNPANMARLPKLKEKLDHMITSLAEAAEDSEARNQSPLAGQVRLALLQTWGVRDGYTLAVGKTASFLQMDAPTLSMVDVFILNSDGVIDELLTAFGGKEEDAEDMLLQQQKEALLQSMGQPTTSLRKGSSDVLLQLKEKRAKAKAAKRRPGQVGHCTGLVRVAEGNAELFFGHTTWEPFSEMTRIWKVYDFPLQNVAAKKISFSSYPGCISSTDDYYLMDSGLAITETTLNLPRSQSYPTTATMPDFIRIMATNRLASTAQDWAQGMSDTATGTYSSQWLIADYKKFTPGQDLQPGTFVVLEQVPGVNHAEDMTSKLQKDGYWASFDRAYFDDVRDSTGDNKQEKHEEGEQAVIYSKDNTPRAQIARRTAHSVSSLDTMRAEMTRNLGTSEPVDEASLQIPRFAISARDDLRNAQDMNPDGSPEGGVDSKITDSCLFRSLTANAISSPSHSTLPAFEWTKNGAETWPGYPHEGLPDKADFDWVSVQAQDDMLSPIDGSGSCK